MPNPDPMSGDVLTPSMRKPGLEDKAREGLEQAREQASGLYRRGLERARDLEHQLEDRIAERPIQSSLIAVGLGVGIGVGLGLLLAPLFGSRR
jgi:ElaB/YqjD/DUF883 family membrane-anchored ribosome-binding protein